MSCAERGETLKTIHQELQLFKCFDSYSYMLRNPIYLGHLRINGDLDQNFTEPLIDPETWQAVQDGFTAIDALHSHPRRRSSRFLFSGLARCGVCGKYLSGYTNTIEGKKYDYYKCNGAYICKPRFAVSKSLLEETVLNTIQETLSTPGYLDTAYQNYLKLQAEHPDQATQLAADLKSATGDISRIVAAIRSAGHSPALLAELKELEQRQADLQQRLFQAAMKRNLLSWEDFQEAIATS